MCGAMGRGVPVQPGGAGGDLGGGEVSGYVGIAVDITERKQMLAQVTHLATHDPTD